MSTFSKSKLALMTLFWSVMFLADVFVIFYGLFELFVAEYLIGLILVVYGIIAIYGNWWHVCVALEQINGHKQLTEPADGPQAAPTSHADPQTQASSLVTDAPASRGRGHRKKSLTRMLGLSNRSLAEEQMASRRRALGLDPDNPSVETDSAADDHPVSDEYAKSFAVDDLTGSHESLADRRKAMAARHAAQSVKHGYDLRDIPTLRLAAEPSPEERRIPGELAPDDWIDDEETNKIIQETLAKRRAAKSQAEDDDDDAIADDIIADDTIADDDDILTDEHPSSSADDDDDDDDDVIPDDFDPNDDQAISKMIAQYDAEQSAKSKHAAKSDDESDDDESKSDAADESDTKSDTKSDDESKSYD